ncbi:hypothetical protein GO730_31460 [Spirosoma sp. HMF3257]|uniref:hypothetical protein n=1 Tax=Spirosoma telluris TaxID=2183553 RepID=UPI0012FA3EF8|nr:hypothetical protein [Spirosoma telluris]
MNNVYTKFLFFTGKGGVGKTAELNKINEGLSRACTTEMASFDEFSRFSTGEESPDS